MTTDLRKNTHNDLSDIKERVREKLTNYSRYNFTQAQNNLLKCFFDLAQEFDTIHDLYRICVVAPYETLGLECSLYLLDEEEKHLNLVCTGSEGIPTEQKPVPTGIYLEAEPYTTGNSYVVPIYRKSALVEKIDTSAEHDEPNEIFHKQTQGWLQHKSSIMGMLEVSPLADISEADRFFFIKYANRIGFRLHNRLMARQNIRHLKFINHLVMDIEHNVIIPNMYFRYLFNQLQKKLVEMADLEEKLKERSAVGGLDEKNCRETIDAIAALRNDIEGYHQEMRKHHGNVSLFLESLFRREHFERGHLVLHPKRCMVENEIIKPQLEHYEKRLKAGGVTIDPPKEMAQEEFPLLVDVGLLAQVYANLFSNAVKYTEPVYDHRGGLRKALAYGREMIRDCFGPGQDGVKFNVFTTGSHLPGTEIELVFSEGGRGRNSQGRQGTGHGLAFIKHVIEMHGGRVGYEATAEGNNFFFILPLPRIQSFAHFTEE